MAARRIRRHRLENSPTASALSRSTGPSACSRPCSTAVPPAGHRPRLPRSRQVVAVTAVLPRQPPWIPNPCRARDRGRPPTTPDRLLGRLQGVGTPAHHLHAPDPAARPDRRHRPGHRRTRPRLRHRHRARRRAARRVRQPPRDRLPGLLAGLQARRPPARPRRTGRRQGHPRDHHGASVRVRHPHRAVVRPGPRPPDARQDRAALPPPPRRQRPPLPARPGHLLPDPARRG